MTTVLCHSLTYITMSAMSMRPQVTFAIAQRRLCKPLGILKLANAGHRRKADRPKLKNALADLSCPKTAVDNWGRFQINTEVRHYELAQLYAMQSSFYCSLRVFSILRCICSRDAYLQNVILDQIGTYLSFNCSSYIQFDCLSIAVALKMNLSTDREG